MDLRYTGGYKSGVYLAIYERTLPNGVPQKHPRVRELGGSELLAGPTELPIEDIPPQLKALREAIEASDASSVERIAHTLQGRCGNMEH